MNYTTRLDELFQNRPLTTVERILRDYVSQRKIEEVQKETNNSKTVFTNPLDTARQMTDRLAKLNEQSIETTDRINDRLVDSPVHIRSHSK